MSIEEKFKEAVQFVRDSPVKEVTPEEKLLYYGLYKQATQGDNTQPKPYAFQFEAKAKWEAWNSQKGLPKGEAMQKYVNLVKTISPSWESKKEQ